MTSRASATVILPCFFRYSTTSAANRSKVSLQVNRAAQINNFVVLLQICDKSSSRLCRRQISLRGLSTDGHSLVNRPNMRFLALFLTLVTNLRHILAL